MRGTGVFAIGTRIGPGATDIDGTCASGNALKKSDVAKLLSYAREIMAQAYLVFGDIEGSPQPAKADISPNGADSRFDPEPT